MATPTRSPKEFAVLISELDEFLYPTQLSDGEPIPDDAMMCYRKWHEVEDRLQTETLTKQQREALEMDAEDLRLQYAALAGLCM